MGGSWASWALVAGGVCLVMAAIVLPFLPQTSRAFLIEDAFEDPGLLLVALGALAGRQRLWLLGMVGALVLLAADLGWRFLDGGAFLHVAWMVGTVLVASWACLPWRGAGPSLAVAQVAALVAAVAWLAHGAFLAMGEPLPTTPFSGIALLIAFGVAIALRGRALHKAPTLL